MVTKLLIALVLMAVSVAIHAAGVSAALGWLRRQSHAQRFGRLTWLFIVVAGWMILLHLAEIAVWALFYLFTGAIPDLASSLYFSAVTVHDHRLWRCGPASRLSPGRRRGSPDGDSDVRLVHRILLRRRRADLQQDIGRPLVVSRRTQVHEEREARSDPAFVAWSE